MPPPPPPPLRKSGTGARARERTARKPNNIDVEQGPPPLPEHWEELAAADGQKYYYNSVTKATSWLRPEPTAAEKRARSAQEYSDLKQDDDEDSEYELPPDYEEHQDDDGTPYFYHVPTGHVSWTRPAAGGGSEERHSNSGARVLRYTARV